MTEELLAQATKIKNRIDILERMLGEDKGRNPLNITMGMGTTLVVERDTNMYNFFLEGLQEELNRLKTDFEQL
nr:MAG TPA: shock protein B [Caudoviricetes sp.]DAX47306.1 MAG TPA: shock protein B [Caudoviricetes sp.]